MAPSPVRWVTPARPHEAVQPPHLTEEEEQ
nr:MAG TPA: hypothetical protein [Caudoviricetes sp.]